MTGTRLHRYDFGALRDFRGPIVAAAVPEAIEIAPPPPPPPVFTEEEIKAASAAGEQIGYSEGFKAGLARAEEQADAQRIAAEVTMQQMATLLQSLQQGYQQVLDSESADLSELVLRIARKVAGDALTSNGAESINAFVAQCLPVILARPRLSIDLHPEAFEFSADSIEAMLQRAGFEGEIQFRPNPALGRHDATLDWGTGQATRSTDTLWQEIEALLRAMPITPAPIPAAYQPPPAPEAAPIPEAAPTLDVAPIPETDTTLIPPTA